MSADRSPWERSWTLRRWHGAGIRSCALVLLALFATTPASAVQRLVRRFDGGAFPGLLTVERMNQDRDGFLWLGTAGGLARFDGTTVRPWDRESVPGAIETVLVGRAGEILVTDHPTRALFRLTGDSLTPELDRSGLQWTGVFDPTIAPDGSLWFIQGEELVRTGHGGSTRLSPSDGFGGEPFYRIHGLEGTQLLVSTRAELWSVADDGTAVSLLRLERIVDVQRMPDGSLYLLCLADSGGGLVHHWRDGELRRVYTTPAVPYSLIRRGETAWAGFDCEVVALRGGQTPERLDVDSITGGVGGRLFVDREQSLWLATDVGLFQLPEPDTVLWTKADGLPSPSIRYIADSGDGIWLVTWLGLVRSSPAGWQEAFVEDEPFRGGGHACVDGGGRLWAMNLSGEDVVVAEERNGAFTAHRYQGREYAGRCAQAPDGTVWMTVDATILQTTREGGRPIERGTLPIGGRVATALFEGAEQTLWVGADGEVCHAPVQDVDRPDAWDCEPLPGPHQVKSLLQMPSGALWAATSGGVLRRADAGVWQLVPASADLPSRWTFMLRPSTSGGTWVAGHGTLLRVAERLDIESGWAVLERPGAWNGITTQGAGDVIEQADGTLWIASAAGVVRVPPVARFAAMPAPTVRLIEARVDDGTLPLHGSPTLSHAENRMELRFAALSYRNPAQIRYRMRSRAEEAWSESRLPAFRLIELPPGRYAPELAASLDGADWSAATVPFVFRVAAPWFRRPWAIGGMAGLLGLALYAIYRVRLGVMLQLERQRARIAMDLHDQLGAGLGSIGILASLVADRALPEHDRRSMAEKIGETADELGTGLRDIIWSLRSGSGTLGALATHLAERGSRLFPDGRPELRTQFPETLPDAPLSLTLRRNLQMIAVEALHNAARHAAGTKVVIGLRQDTRHWTLWVEDDGRGMDSRPSRTAGGGPGGDGLARGLGLESMRTRARQVGADIAWSRGELGGTRVDVCFRLKNSEETAPRRSSAGAAA